MICVHYSESNRRACAEKQPPLPFLIFSPTVPKQPLVFFKICVFLDLVLSSTLYEYIRSSFFKVAGASVTLYDVN